MQYRVVVVVIVWVLVASHEVDLAAVRRIFEMTCIYWEVAKCRRKEGPDYKVLANGKGEARRVRTHRCNIFRPAIT